MNPQAHEISALNTASGVIDFQIEVVLFEALLGGKRYGSRNLIRKYIPRKFSAQFCSCSISHLYKVEEFIWNELPSLSRILIQFWYKTHSPLSQSGMWKYSLCEPISNVTVGLVLAKHLFYFSLKIHQSKKWKLGDLIDWTYMPLC